MVIAGMVDGLRRLFWTRQKLREICCDSDAEFNTSKLYGMIPVCSVEGVAESYDAKIFTIATLLGGHLVCPTPSWICW